MSHFRKFIDLTLLPVVLSFNCSLALLANEPSASETVSQYISANAFDTALKFINKQMKTKPQCAELFQLKGAVYACQNKNDLAMNNFNKALFLLKNDTSLENALVKADALHNRAGLFAQMGKVQEAERDYKESIRIGPSDSSPYFELGKLQLKQKRHTEARQSFVNARALAVKETDKEKIQEIDKWIKQLDATKLR